MIKGKETELTQRQKTATFFIALPLLALFAINFLFGFEPQITRLLYSSKPMVHMSFSEYMESSVRQNGDTVFVWTLTALVYPGAKLGQLAHNQLL